MKYILIMFILLKINIANAGSLEQAIQTMLLENPSLDGKKSEILSSIANRDAVKAERLPSISFFVSEMNDSYEQGVLTIDQTLYTFGNLSSRIDRANAEIENQNNDLSLTLRELYEQTAHRYNELYYAKEIAKIGELNITEHQKLLDHIQRRLEGKLASEADVGLGFSRLTNAKIQQRNFVKQLRNSASALATLTIKSVDAIEPVDIEQWGDLSLLKEDIEKLADSDFNVIKKKSLIKVANASLEVAQTENLPQLKLRAEHNFLDKPIQGDKNRIGLVLESKFEGLGFVRSFKEDSQTQSLIASKKDYEATKYRVVREIEILFEDFISNKQNLVLQQNSVGLVEDTFESYFRQYRAGRKSWIDVLNIQRELVQQRIELLNIERSLKNDAISLAVRLGTFDNILVE